MANIPAEYPLTVYKGNDFREVLVIKDDDGDIIDLTGWSAAAQIRTKNKRTATLIVEFTVTIPTPANGEIILTLTDTQTGAITRSKGYWDILVTSPTNFDETYMYGEVTFEETVTTD